MLTDGNEVLVRMAQEHLRLVHDQDGSWYLIANNGYPPPNGSSAVEAATGQELVDPGQVYDPVAHTPHGKYENFVYHVANRRNEPC